MRRLVAVMLLAVPALAQEARMDVPRVRLLAGDIAHTVVEVTFPVAQMPADWQGAVLWAIPPEVIAGQPQAARQGVTIAVPADSRPVWRVTGVQWWRAPARSADPSELVRGSGPGIMRGVGLLNLTVLPTAADGVLASLVVTIDHPAGDGTAPLLAAAADASRLLAEVATEALPPTLVNPESFRLLRVASRLSSAKRADSPRDVRLDRFGLTGNWVKLEVEETGVYAVTGNQLRLMGVSIAEIDTATLHLFRGGSLMLAEDPTVTEAEQIGRVGLTEIACDFQEVGSPDGVFDESDRILFYGFGTDAWLDRLNPAAWPLETFEHLYCSRGVYWLTWEEGTTPSPFGPRQDIPVQPRPPLADVGTTQTQWARYHGEESYASLPGVLEDMWAWESRVISSVTQSFVPQAVATDAPATFVVDVRGRYEDHYGPVFVTRAWLNDDDHDADPAGVDSLSFRLTDQNDSTRVRLIGQTTDIRSGVNTVHLSYDSYSGLGQGQPLVFDSFDVRYRQVLDKRQVSGALVCNRWADDAAPVNIEITLPAGAAVSAWDVTRSEQPTVVVRDAAGVNSTLTLGFDGQAQLVVFEAADLLTVAGGQRVTVADLRDPAGPAADYIVLYHPSFRAAAQSLAELRSRRLPGVADPMALAICVDDVYANFSGGQKDLLAIRNFLKWHYENHGQRLRFVCLLGDASYDFRNYLGHDPDTQLYDFVPAPVVRVFPTTSGYGADSDPFTSDEALVCFDRPLDDLPVGNEFDIPDLAIGRLTVTTPAEAAEYAGRIRRYEETPESGPWRNRAVFCADDLRIPRFNNDQASQVYHTDQAEVLANVYLPPSLELEKVYLINFPFVGAYKPAARSELLRRLNAGQTIFYYVGHGSPGQLADEQVMLGTDASGLTNGDRRFLFLALSCDVGVLADPGRQSMAEQLVISRDGGAIAAIAASWLSYVGSNNVLSNFLLGALYPDRHVTAAASLGEALRVAKAALWANNGGSIRNSRRYNLLGDPAQHLPNPVDDLAFAPASMDSLLTGRPHQVLLDLESQGIDLSGDAVYDLRVEDSAADFPYFPGYTWRETGHTAFRGNGSIAADPLEIRFLAPLQMRRGEFGRVRLIVSDGYTERAAVMPVPVVGVAASAGDDRQGPRITLNFADNRFRVQVGTELRASLHDTSGINILGSNPANSLLLEFDNSGIYSNVSDRFTFAPGSYTRGSLDVPLPSDLELGAHQVALLASDMFGNVGADTVGFELVATGISDLEDVTVFPNPTPGPCRLVCEVSDPMDLQWDIYTISGHRVRSVRESLVSPGPQILEWDGRDGQGDLLANGVYLYVLRGRSTGDADHPIRKTGQLVIMR